jgi:hypothetical protein
MSLTIDREPVEVDLAGGKTAVICEYIVRNGCLIFPWPHYRLSNVMGWRVATPGNWREVDRES